MSCHFFKVVLFRLTASLFLCSIGWPLFATSAEPDISAVIMEMEDRDANIREEAVRKLNRSMLNKRSIKTRDEAIAGLKRLLKDPEKSVRYAAAGSPILIDCSCKEAVPVLIEALKEDDNLALGYLSALELYGRNAESAVPAIIEAMKKKPDNRLWESSCALALEAIGTPEALEAIKPHKQKIARQIKLMKNPIKALRDSLSGAFAMTFGFLGLFWWSRARRKKGDRIISWPLLIPVPFWGFCIYEAFWLRANTGAIITFFEAEFYFDIGLLVVTSAGIIPWLLSLWRWRKHRPLNAPTP